MLFLCDMQGMQRSGALADVGGCVCFVCSLGVP